MLRYPKWIPGEHGPNGPIVDIAGLVIRAAGKPAPLPWRRDDVDLYAIHVDVPAGAAALEVAFDYLAPAERELYSSGGSTTSSLLALEWNLVVFYPAGVSQHDFIVTPRLILPHGWHTGSALETAKTSGDTIELKPVSLETLVDSPVIAGANFRSFPLSTAANEPVHTLDVVADSEAALALEPAQLDALRRLVVEAGALFGARHYARYHFLLTLSDHVAHFGLEHHQSSDNRTRERFFIDKDARLLSSGLLPHEFVHSWNGKFRRPVGLATDGFDAPMRGDLLWVYEGLTSYFGWVLTMRSGLNTPEEWREDLASHRRLHGHARRPRLAPARRHRHQRADLPSLVGRVAVVAPLHRLLPRGRPSVARRRRHHPHALGRRQVARRLRARLLRRTQPRRRGQAVHARRHRRHARRRRRLRLARVLPRAHRRDPAARAARRHHRRRLAAALRRQAQRAAARRRQGGQDRRTSPSRSASR